MGFGIVSSIQRFRKALSGSNQPVQAKKPGLDLVMHVLSQPVPAQEPGLDQAVTCCCRRLEEWEGFEEYATCSCLEDDRIQTQARINRSRSESH